MGQTATSGSHNTAEGGSEFKPLEKARFYRMALRSVSEMCSNVQIGNRLKIVGNDDYAEAYALFTRLAQTLTKLAVSMEHRTSARDRVGSAHPLPGGAPP